MMMSLAIRGSTCEEGGDDKYNHKDQTTKVNVRNGFEIENILKDLGNKNDNELAFLKMKSKANTFKHKG